MKLSEVYIVIRGSILMMNPLSTMAQVFSLLIQDKHQREIKPSNHLTLESTALHGGTSRTPNYKTDYSTSNSKNSSQSQYKYRFCNYCKKSGHTIEKYYQLHGYPPGSTSSNQNQRNNQHQRSNTFRVPPRSNQNIHTAGYNRTNGNGTVVNAHCTQGLIIGKETSTDHYEEMYNVNLTKDQYSQVQGLLQNFQKGNGGEGSTVGPLFRNGTTDFAGLFHEKASGDW